MSLRQGRKSVLDYAIEFRTLAADSRWNETALNDAFFKLTIPESDGQADLP